MVPSATSTCHVPAPSISKTYELFMPAVLDASTRVSRVSKNSRGSIEPRAYRKEEELRRVLGCRRQVPVDERMRQVPLGAGDRDAVALEGSGARIRSAKRLPLEGQAAEELGERLDGLRRASTSEAKGPQRCHCHSVHRPAEGKVKTL